MINLTKITVFSLHILVYGQWAIYSSYLVNIPSIYPIYLLYSILNYVNFASINKSYTTTMKVLLDIQDNKALSLLEVLKSLPYVRTKTLTDTKAKLMEEIREAVENLKLVRQGKLKARNAKDLLNEL